MAVTAGPGSTNRRLHPEARSGPGPGQRRKTALFAHALKYHCNLYCFNLAAMFCIPMDSKDGKH